MPKQSSSLKSRLYEEQIKTKVLNEELEHGLIEVDRWKKRKISLINQVNEEHSKQNQLKKKIAKLKSYYDDLNLSNDEFEKLILKLRKERSSLEQELKTLESVTQELEITTHFETQTMTTLEDVDKSLIGVKDREKDLMVVRTCLRYFIQATEDNEFSDFNWKAKLALDQNQIQMRLKIENISFRKQDLNKIYKPVISVLGGLFRKYGLEISTKSSAKNSIIEVLDIRFKLPLIESRVDHLEVRNIS